MVRGPVREVIAKQALLALAEVRYSDDNALVRQTAETTIAAYPDAIEKVPGAPPIQTVSYAIRARPALVWRELLVQTGLFTWALTTIITG